MPRVARVVAVAVPHHVTQRGNNRQDVFFGDDDRLTYLKILAQQCRKHRVAALGYCLMDNHVHLILIPATADGLAKAVGRANFLYTQYVNRLHRRSGHLWQNRFFSCALDDEHALLAMRYVEWNPLRARMCRLARRYRWSSAAAHCRGKDESGMLDMNRWQELSGARDWEAVLEQPLSPAQNARVRRQTRTGRPLAGDSFISKLERALGRRLRPLPAGRPRRAAPKSKPARRQGEK